MRRITIFAYGVACYAVFFATFLYAAGFVGGFLAPTSLDGPRSRPLGEALAIDAALLALFALQHSVMARPAFKRWWTRFVPEPAERSTYVLFSSLALVLLFGFWEPLGGTVWHVDHPAGRAVLWAIFASGWLMVLVSTFLINHFDLFGLRQVWLYLRGREYTPLRFRTPGPYRLVRHPLYVGWLTAFWATPTMTAGHLFFALAMTAYILVAIRYEERDLLSYFGNAYAEYRRRVPMLVPRPCRPTPTAAGPPLAAPRA
ncbi:MAG TPA: isoprenylcysteine carboxylmethyltransferase family protein [Planctomycetaceae bacterium]